MKVVFEWNGDPVQVDLDDPIDISIPLADEPEQVNCFFAPPFRTSPVVAGDFVGSTKLGGPLNFLNVQINPHGNGTHTECVGHIAKEHYSIHRTLKKFWFRAQLVTLLPEMQDNGDRIITMASIEGLEIQKDVSALVVRTIPNNDSKLKMMYSGTNPTYMDARVAEWIVEQGIEHLLIDLPSVDREEDGGALAAHKAFWQYPEHPRLDATITELVYVPTKVDDGNYILNLQIGSFEIDVSPSKPVLYALIPTSE